MYYDEKGNYKYEHHTPMTFKMTDAWTIKYHDLSCYRREYTYLCGDVYHNGEKWLFFDSARIYNGRFFVYEVAGKYGVIDLKADCFVVFPRYDLIEVEKYNIIIAVYEGDVGIINSEGVFMKA